MKSLGNRISNRTVRVTRSSSSPAAQVAKMSPSETPEAPVVKLPRLIKSNTAASTANVALARVSRSPATRTGVPNGRE